jgi:hypothetical protein
MKTELFTVKEICLAYKIPKTTVLKNIKRLNLNPYRKQKDLGFYFDLKQVRQIITYNENKPIEVPYFEYDVVKWFVAPSRMNWDKSI